MQFLKASLPTNKKMAWTNLWINLIYSFFLINRLYNLNLIMCSPEPKKLDCIHIVKQKNTVKKRAFLLFYSFLRNRHCVAAFFHFFIYIFVYKESSSKYFSNRCGVFSLSIAMKKSTGLLIVRSECPM